MDKLKESDQKVRVVASNDTACTGVEAHGIQAGEAAAQGADGGLEDIFSRMRGDLDSEESEEELKGILETMMSQLMSKEVLYEPLKELHDKVRTAKHPVTYTLNAAAVPLVSERQ